MRSAMTMLCDHLVSVRIVALTRRRVPGSSRSLKEPPQSGHHALARTTAPHVDVAVVGVAHETMALPRHLLVKVGEQDVGEQQ